MSAPAYRKVLNPGIGKSDKGKESLQKIMLAARKILTEQGYQSFSIRNIASEAHVHVSNVYYYFPSKENLLKGLIQDVIDGYTHDLQERFSHETDPGKRFIGMINYLLEEMHHSENRCFYTQLWALMASDEKISAEFLEGFLSSYRNRIYDMIEPISPGIDRATRNRRAILIAALMEGLLLILGSGTHQTTDLDGIEEDIRNLVLKIATEEAK